MAKKKYKKKYTLKKRGIAAETFGGKKRSLAAKKAWRTRRKRYGKNGIKG